MFREHRDITCMWKHIQMSQRHIIDIENRFYPKKNMPIYLHLIIKYSGFWDYQTCGNSNQNVIQSKISSAKIEVNAQSLNLPEYILIIIPPRAWNVPFHFAGVYLSVTNPTPTRRDASSSPILPWHRTTLTSLYTVHSSTPFSQYNNNNLSPRTPRYLRVVDAISVYDSHFGINALLLLNFLWGEFLADNEVLCYSVHKYFIISASELINIFVKNIWVKWGIL